MRSISIEEFEKFVTPFFREDSNVTVDVIKDGRNIIGEIRVINYKGIEYPSSETISKFKKFLSAGKVDADSYQTSQVDINGNPQNILEIYVL